MPNFVFFKNIMQNGTYYFTAGCKDFNHKLVNDFIACNATIVAEEVRKDTFGLVSNAYQQIAAEGWCDPDDASSWTAHPWEPWRWYELYREINMTVNPEFEACALQAFEQEYKGDRFFNDMIMLGIMGLSAMTLLSCFCWLEYRKERIERRLMQEALLRSQARLVNVPPAPVAQPMLPPVNQVIYIVNSPFNIFRNAEQGSPPFSKRLAKLLRRANNQLEVPAALCCAWSGRLMDDPITLSCGFTCDRKVVLREFARQRHVRQIRCKKTKRFIAKEECQHASNVEIKAKIDEFIQAAEAGVAAVGNRNDLQEVLTSSATEYGNFTAVRIQEPLLPLPPTRRSQNLLKKNPSLDIPKSIMCPITHEVMDDPVTLSSGITCERKVMIKYFGNETIKKCPCTNKQLSRSELKFKANETVKQWTEEFLERKEAEYKNRNYLPVSSERYISLVSTGNRFLNIITRGYIPLFASSDEIELTAARRNSIP